MKGYRKELWFNTDKRMSFINHEPIRQYRHNNTGEDNADAHIKRLIMGREVVAAITEGKLEFAL